MSADEESFARWAGGRRLALLRTAVLLTGDHHRAQDLVQEALTAVARRWSRLHDQQPEAYARQTMVRANISWWRKHRHEVVGDPPDRPVPTTAGDAVDRRLLLDAALARLTAKQRAVVVLRYFDDLGERETADLLGVGVGTVKSQTHLALRRLRENAPELADLLDDRRTDPDRRHREDVR